MALLRTSALAFALCLSGANASAAGAGGEQEADSASAASVDAVADNSPAAVSKKDRDRATQDSVVRHLPRKSKDAISSPVKYTAKDSAVFYTGGVAYLYGDAKVDYQDLSLKSASIRLRMDSSLVQARGRRDTSGELVETPVFEQGKDKYESEAIDYNFKTQKGLIRGVVTQQGDGYVTGEKAKKMNDGTFQMVDGKYTTCDNHKNPHFYLDLTQAKVKPKEYVVTGPAYLVLLDVPIPLFLPFGYFPFTSSYSSGLLMPSYGYDSERGYYLKDGGYYFAINDYVDLALRADVYTKGSWGLNGTSHYRKRYRYNGNFLISYQKTVYGEEPNLPDYSEMKDMKVIWTHTQDPKANPFSTLSASVNFSSSSYNKNNSDSYYNTAAYAENNKSSSINYQLQLPGTPLSLSTNATLNQRQSDSSIALSMPNLYLNMSRVNPFKRKKFVGKEKWYEKVYVSYNMNFNNNYSTKEDQFEFGDIFSKGNNGFRHSINTGASYTVLKYFVLAPSINYNERWYFNRYDQSWDERKDELVIDTTRGFYRVYDVSTSLNLSTQLYGFFRPMPFVGGRKINMIRHVLRPTVGFSWSPVIDDDNTGTYYREVPGSGRINTIEYNRFSGGIFGAPSNNSSGYINLSLNNNVEMKVNSKKDSTGFRKISLIDNLSGSANYDMFADSLKWSDINTSMRLKVTKQVSINVNATFTPYTYRLNEYGNPEKVDVSEWKKNGRIARMRRVQTSFGYAFSNNTFKRDKKKGDDDPNRNENNSIDGFEPTPEERDAQRAEAEKAKLVDGYQPFSMPWNLRFDYSISYADAEFNKRRLTYDKEVMQTLNCSGSLQLSPNWDVSFSTGYDFDEKEISYTSFQIQRSMHCWYASVDLVPFGDNFSYKFHIGVRASMLQDLKYEKRKSANDYPYWKDSWF